MMSGVPLETSWAFKKLWNNKFYYKSASCCYFYWIIHDARIHEYQIFRLSLTLIIGITSKLLWISVGTEVILCNHFMILFSCLPPPLSTNIISSSLSMILPSYNLTLFTHYSWYKVVKYYMIFHLLTLRWIMSYIYGAPILDVSRSHTTTQHSR